VVVVVVVVVSGGGVGGAVGGCGGGGGGAGEGAEEGCAGGTDEEAGHCWFSVFLCVFFLWGGGGVGSFNVAYALANLDAVPWEVEKATLVGMVRLPSPDMGGGGRCSKAEAASARDQAGCLTRGGWGRGLWVTQAEMKRARIAPPTQFQVSNRRLGRYYLYLPFTSASTRPDQLNFPSSSQLPIAHCPLPIANRQSPIAIRAHHGFTSPIPVHSFQAASSSNNM
jgi:hypothetical protein